MKNKLLKWLDDTGYPLELKSEKILSGIGFKVLNSVYYEDDELEKNRELDLQAEYSIENQEVISGISFLIECKSSKKPFIQLKVNNSDDKSLGYFLGCNYIVEQVMWRSALACANNQISMPGKTCESFKMIQGFTNTDETIYKAANTLTKSFRYFSIEIEEFLESLIEDNFHQIFIPILIIDSPMYQLSLVNNKTELNKIDSAILNFEDPRKGEIGNNYKIPVIHIDYLEQFGLNAIKSCERLLNSLILKPEYQIKNSTNSVLKIKNIDDAD